MWSDCPGGFKCAEPHRAFAFEQRSFGFPKIRLLANAYQIQWRLAATQKGMLMSRSSLSLLLLGRHFAARRRAGSAA
jgi:hypothetical protein